MKPAIGDKRSKELAKRLRNSAEEVGELRRQTIIKIMPRTLFISHTSLDDAFITGSEFDNPMIQKGSILDTCWGFFYDPFYHSMKTGGAEAYEKLVGLALLASVRVLAIWSQNAILSDYVRAEILIAVEEHKKLAVYLAPNSPPFTFAEVPQLASHESLVSLLQSWVAT